MAAAQKAYCLRCRGKQPMLMAKKVKNMLRGTCSKCGGKVCLIVAKSA